MLRKPALAGWHFEARDIAEAIAGERLLNPSIDLGVVCDLNCPYCFTEDILGDRRSARPDAMTEKETFEVLDDFICAGARTVNIVGAGEPLLNRSFMAVVKHLAAENVRTVVFTNGTRLAADDDLINFVAGLDVTVVLKFNSCNALVQDAVAGRRGYTERRNLALRKLVSLGLTTAEPTRLGIDTLAFAGNFHELPEIHRWCRVSNIYPLTSDFIPTGRTKCGGLESREGAAGPDAELATIAGAALQPLTTQQRADLRASLQEIDAQMGIVQHTAAAYYGGGACTQILGVYVDVEGNVWPCVARTTLHGPADQPLGNIRTGTTPSTAWRTSEYLSWIRRTYSGACPYKAPLCMARGDEHATHLTDIAADTHAV